ncbi:amino acid ABC transporter ATP-binding protein [Pikeienuella sp. HZG-20]|uniref:amino acid ABC transporter ATP-binding protein n=1 Tax=Paludibacillus litoralis TaxID=3133267 RepID=UPI0030EBB3F5
MSEAITSGAQPAAREPAIRFEDVHKYFGPFQALDGVNLTVRRGEVVVVLGPSGSGKSTLIRCINGLEDFQRGRIMVGDVPVDHRLGTIPQIRRKVGMVFQQFNLFPHLSVIENCTVGLVMTRGMTERRAREWAMEFLVRVRVEDQARKYPSELSGGQQQRVAIARALCLQPEVLLFDEPTSALDPEMVKEVLDVMKDLAESGITMICVTHEMGFARAVADRMVFMDGGRILYDEAPDVIFDQPRTGRLEEFFSHISNFT